MSRAKRKYHWPMLFVLAGLLVISTAFIHSASFDSETGTYRDFAGKQLQWLMIGFAAFMAVLPINTRRYKSWSYLFYAGSLGLLVLVFLIGETHKGAQRWIALTSTVKVQPSEFVKLTVILAAARYMSERDMSRGWLRPLVALALAGVPVLLILRQPDLGTSLVFFPVVLSMLWVAGAKKKFIGAVILVGLLLVPVAWTFVLKDYQKGRLVVFLSPENPNKVLKLFVPKDELSDMRKVDSYHLIQSKIAVGSGGVWGKGYGRGTQNTLGYLPEKHTDFIFGVIAEEWGFVGCAILLGLFFLLMLMAYDVAVEVQDPFGRYVSVGISTLFFTHVAVNTAMTVGLAPITGLTLPFISYGGSSVVTFFLALGLITNVHRHRTYRFIGPGKNT